MAGERAGHPLWTFSLALYAREGVAADCLRLQDEGGADVNLILMGLWLAVERGIQLSAEDAAAVVTATKAWRDGIVRPLREARRASKTTRLVDEAAQERFRAKLKAVELESERIEQDFLHRWCTGHWPTAGADRSPASAAANVGVLLVAQCGGEFADGAREIGTTLAVNAAATLSGHH